MGFLWEKQVNLYISLGNIGNGKGRGLLGRGQGSFCGQVDRCVLIPPEAEKGGKARSPNLAQRGISAAGDLSQIFGNFSVCASLLAVCVPAQTPPVNFLLLTHSSSDGQTFTHLDLKQTA